MSFLRPKILHKHDWDLIYVSRWGAVERCKCGEFQTTLRELTSGEAIKVPGNILCTLATNFYILCGTEEEYREACAQLEERMKLAGGQCHRLYKPEQVDGWLVPPSIYLWGTWWENELIQSETVRNALNGWL